MARSSYSRKKALERIKHAWERGDIMDYYIDGDVAYYTDRSGHRRPYQLPPEEDWYYDDDYRYGGGYTTTTSNSTMTYTVPQATYQPVKEYKGQKEPDPPKKAPLDWLFNEVEKTCRLARVA